MPDMEDDIGADIAASIAELKGATSPEPAPAAAAAAVEELATGAEGGEQPEHKIDATGRAHAKDGKFAEKPQGKAAKGKEKPEADPKAVKEEPAQVGEAKAAKEGEDAKPQGEQPKPLQPPSHWSPQAKADFVNAPRSIQEQALKREEEISSKSKEWQGKAEDFNRLDKVLAPHKDRWARAGMSPDTAVNQLLSMERAIASNPVNGVAEVLRAFARGNELRVINEIARANGYQLTKANNQGQTPAHGDGNQPQPLDLDNHPTVRRLNATIQNLTSNLSSRQEADAQARQQAVRSEIEAFKSDPAHLYYENVKGKMAALLRVGDDAGDTRPIRERLQEAYDEAVFADPTTRAIVLADQKKREEADVARKAAAARHAGGSVTGSPGNGAPAPRRQSLSSSIEDDVREAVLEHRA